MSNLDYEFCNRCGALKLRGKICQSCQPYVTTPERKNKSKRDAKEQHARMEKKREALERVSTPHSPKKKTRRRMVRYSEAGGLEWDFEIDPEVKRTRMNMCVKCRQMRLCYAGNWVRAGGRNAPLDGETRVKRVFLCTQCWSPNKKRRERESGEE